MKLIRGLCFVFIFLGVSPAYSQVVVLEPEQQSLNVLLPPSEIESPPPNA